MEIGDSVDIAAVVPKGFFQYYILLLRTLWCGFKRSANSAMSFYKNDMEVGWGIVAGLYNGYVFVNKMHEFADGSYEVVDTILIDWKGHVENKDIVVSFCKIYRVNSLKDVFTLLKSKSFDKLEANCENKHNEYILDTL
jgi:hypothetical protein